MRRNIVVATVGLFIVTIVFYLPYFTSGVTSGRVFTTRHDITALFCALNTYYDDYGHFPAIRADGRYETAADNAKLLQVLLGKDETENPRKIVYFQPSMTVSHPHRSGLNAQGGMVDEWGYPYRFRIDRSHQGRIDNPYKDDHFSWLATNVIVWSVGKDGIQGSASARDVLNSESDDVVSWQ